MAHTLDEAVSYHDLDRKANKGISNTALGLGIAGTALGLGLFNGNGNGLSGLFGGNCNSKNGPTAWEAWQKEANDDLALTRAIYDMRIKDLEEKQGIYNYFNGQVAGLDKRVFALEAEKPFEAKILDLQFQLAKCYTNEKFVESIDYTNARTCRMITGELVLPSTPVITGYGSYPAPCIPQPVVAQ